MKFLFLEVINAVTIRMQDLKSVLFWLLWFDRSMIVTGRKEMDRSYQTWRTTGYNNEFSLLNSIFKMVKVWLLRCSKCIKFSVKITFQIYQQEYLKSSTVLVQLFVVVVWKQRTRQFAKLWPRARNLDSLFCTRTGRSNSYSSPYHQRFLTSYLQNAIEWTGTVYLIWGLENRRMIVVKNVYPKRVILVWFVVSRNNGTILLSKRDN